MRIQYNEIDLNVVQPIAIERTAVLDSAGMDTLYYHWRVVVEATYSPEILPKNWQFVSYGTQGEGPNAQPNPSHPVRNYRNPPPYTDQAIRQRLMEPQKKLYIWWDSDLEPNASDPRQYWVEAPSEAAPCDPINGPLPAQDVSVTATLGQARTWRVRFAVEFATLDAGWGGQKTTWLLSNRWTAAITADEQFLETRTITGEAVFRSDMLRKFGWIPDDFRSYLVPPVSGRSRRYIDEIAVMPDGFTVRYKIRDVEMPLAQLDVPTLPSGNVVSGAKPRNIAKINMRVKRTFTTVGASDVLENTVNAMNQAMSATGMFAYALGNAISGVGELAKATEQAATLGGLAIAAQGAQIAAIGTSLGAAVIQAADNSMPTYTEVVMVEVFGTSKALMADMQRYAYSIAFGQLTGNQQNLLLNINVSAMANWVLGGLPPKVGNAVGKVINEQTRYLNQVNPIPKLLALIPPAAVLDLEYDPTQKYVKVTMAQTYSGLIDIVNTNTLTGRQRMIDPIRDNVIGGDWPSYMDLSRGFALGLYQSNPQVLNQLKQALGTDLQPPTLPDAELLLFAPSGPGIGPPQDGVSRGNSVLDLVVADLLATGGIPPIPMEDDTWQAKPYGFPEFPKPEVPSGPGPTYDDADARKETPEV